MYVKLQRHMDLEPEAPFHNTSYLGCQQFNVELPAQHVKQKAVLRENIPRSSSGDGNDLTSQESSEKAASWENVEAWHYDMCGHAERRVDRYLELIGKSIETPRQAATPCIEDHTLPPEEFEAKGELAPIAAGVVLKAFYLARMKLIDCFWIINSLDRNVTRWNVASDKRLHRLTNYMHHSKAKVQLNRVGMHLAKSKSFCFLMLPPLGASLTLRAPLGHC